MMKTISKRACGVERVCAGPAVGASGQETYGEADE